MEGDDGTCESRPVAVAVVVEAVLESFGSETDEVAERRSRSARGVGGGPLERSEVMFMAGCDGRATRLAACPSSSSACSGGGGSGGGQEQGGVGVCEKLRLLPGRGAIKIGELQPKNDKRLE